MHVGYTYLRLSPSHFRRAREWLVCCKYILTCAYTCGALVPFARVYHTNSHVNDAPHAGKSHITRKYLLPYLWSVLCLLAEQQKYRTKVINIFKSSYVTKVAAWSAWQCLCYESGMVSMTMSMLRKWHGQHVNVYVTKVAWSAWQCLCYKSGMVSMSMSMLRKWRHGQHDDVVRKYEAWCMLGCNVAVFVVFAILTLSHDY